ncbi:hypothetical protein [Aureibacter tunicatorum]|uniref:Uncharacterized protein n=1 Tax=Aureibacter tunicatorum TaxID=866807 RepID=A0AAE3XKM4_9BACT|nr:hypothetical protein [Aureibacter tunicatorum]MDR6238265.1 hypothetical protein [Aureibacter tunicatorum]BDD03298.1 hypothetical protein AUTU_07810 [Aureibacter tunicatorum]
MYLHTNQNKASTKARAIGSGGIAKSAVGSSSPVMQCLMSPGQFIVQTNPIAFGPFQRAQIPQLGAIERLLAQYILFEKYLDEKSVFKRLHLLTELESQISQLYHSRPIKVSEGGNTYPPALFTILTLYDDVNREFELLIAISIRRKYDLWTPQWQTLEDWKGNGPFPEGENLWTYFQKANEIWREITDDKELADLSEASSEQLDLSAEATVDDFFQSGNETASATTDDIAPLAKPENVRKKRKSVRFTLPMEHVDLADNEITTMQYRSKLSMKKHGEASRAKHPQKAARRIEDIKKANKMYEMGTEILPPRPLKVVSKARKELPAPDFNERMHALHARMLFFRKGFEILEQMDKVSIKAANPFVTDASEKHSTPASSSFFATSLHNGQKSYSFAPPWISYTSHLHSTFSQDSSTDFENVIRLEGDFPKREDIPLTPKELA